MRILAELLQTDVPWLDGSRQSIAHSSQQERNPRRRASSGIFSAEVFATDRATAITTSPAPPLMLLRAPRRCATRHKLDIQR